MISRARRSLAKTLTWRIVATTDTFIIAWIITGEWSFAGAIAGVEVITKMFLYYGHERIWNKIRWARNGDDPHTTIWPYRQ